MVKKVSILVLALVMTVAVASTASAWISWCDDGGLVWNLEVCESGGAAVAFVGYVDYFGTNLPVSGSLAVAEMGKAEIVLQAFQLRTSYVPFVYVGTMDLTSASLAASGAWYNVAINSVPVYQGTWSMALCSAELELGPPEGPIPGQE